MNVLMVIGGGIIFAFLARFLVALFTDARIAPATRVAVQHLGQEEASDRGKLVIMSSGVRHRARLSAKSRKAMMVALFGVLLGLGTRGAAQTSDGSANADEVRELRALVQQLQVRVAQLETHSARVETAQPEVAVTGSAKPASELLGEDRSVLAFFRGTAVNLGIDGYYGYNFNRPIGRANLLRAYDVSSNSFSLNQANLIFEQAPDVAAGRRFGARLDLQFGQATEASQGNPANELRPQVYRPVWQAYGTYIAPLGKGLTVDFGKWASPLGIEGNYSKDQMNYSRSYLFNLLPFYHQGVRATYQFNGAVSVMYAVVNGVQQAEDFNGFKSQMVSLTVHPTKSISWSTNYFVGQEQRDAEAGAPTPNGRLHIVDSNATWTVNSKLTLAAEGDYVISRVFSESAPVHVAGGAGYGRYQFTPRVALAARAEYLSDRGGFFSGSTQALKETTLTYEYKFADGFLARAEWRRDFSNRPYFLTETPDVLKKEQNTATLGLMWWWGRKQGSW